MHNKIMIRMYQISNDLLYVNRCFSSTYIDQVQLCLTLVKTNVAD